MSVALMSNRPTKKQMADDPRWKAAKDMYFSGIPPTDIAEELEIEINVLGELIFGPDRSGLDSSCWYSIRVSRPDVSFVSYTRVKSYVLKETEAHIVHTLRRSALGLTTRQEEFDIDDMRKAIDIIEKIDRVTRLEEGKSTVNINVSHGVTLREIQNGHGIVDAEYREISDEQEEESEDDNYNPLA